MRELKPGRELDALIAEKVMNLKYGVTTVELSGSDIFPKHYSTDISAAWEVVHHMTRRNQAETFSLQTSIDRSVHKEHGVRTWRCDFGRAFQKGWAYAFAHTAPHAICLAALATVGHKFTCDDNSAQVHQA